MSSSYEQSFQLLLDSKFDSYDLESLSRFIKISDKIKNTKEFWHFLLNKNLIKTKIGFFDKLRAKKFEINFDINQTIKLLENVETNLNLAQITKYDILTLLDLKKYRNNLSELFLWGEFYTLFNERKFQNLGTLEDSFNQYVLNKKKEAKLNDKILLEQYVEKLKHKYRSRKPDFQKRISECLGKAELQRKWDVSKFIRKYEEELRFLFPIWILSPENVCNLIKLAPNQFSYGIFDEASQIFVENSYPLVYRCTTNIVAGDNKQMPPSNWFARNIDEEDDDDIDYETSNSLLEKVETCKWPAFHLKNHYRSEHSSLISFSNDNIYDNNLEFSTRNGRFSNAIQVFNVNGIWNENSNEQEIEKVLDIIQSTNNEYKNKKILIVTFNQKQSERLDNKFNDRFINTDIYEKYKNNLIVIRNLENVQGDEGDIVILSVSYGKNTQGKIYQNFGALIRQDGHKRLNVAITRAKEKMYVIKSLYASDITSSANKETNIFKSFISYVDDIQNQIQNDNKIEFSEQLNFDSNFEENVYNELSKKINKDKYKLITQFKVGKKRIDLAIYSINDNNVKLGIEINGSKYHSGIQKCLEDLDRKNFLESRGYNIFTITDYDWILKRDFVTKTIMELIK